MANLKSAKKRVHLNNKKRIRNQRFKSDMRTQIKHVENLIEANEKDNALEALKKANKKIDKAIQAGAVHRNNGERHKSRLTKKVNEMGA
ncbi:MAG TPA: 30S ribosomal protein S20 [Pseudogracilibacillus sp.]|nr:30S ribosomal protein S20 [Pseudogracilibacillus sp.]